MAKLNRFGRRSSAEDVTEGLDLTGKTIFITGVNSGLGFESMRVLTMRGAHVIGAARTLEKATAACAEVKGYATPVACELSDLESVAACADLVKEQVSSLDVLLCNAGIMAPRKLSTIDGLEQQFFTNHIGHFLLIKLLLDHVKAANAGRLVILSSMAEQSAPACGIDFDNLAGDRGYQPFKFYGQSKLANLLCARALAQQLQDTSVTVNAVHPGIIRTNLARDAGGMMLTMIGLFARPFEKTQPQGAATQCYAAVHPDLDNITGEYLADCKIKTTSRNGRNMALAQQLWDFSENYVNEATAG